MNVIALDIPDVKLIETARHSDARGFFSEVFNARQFAGHGIDAAFVQDNHSLSRGVGVIRGLHFQSPPHAQGKLVRVVRGAIWDVAVDIRRGSATYGKHVAAELTAENWRQLWVPAGFAHGFCTLQPDSEVVYKVTDYYAPECDLGLAWDDPAIGIDWPAAADKETLSKKDREHPRLEDLPAYFS